MFTRCSYCQIAYEVTPEALVRGRGQLHCAACRRDFDALEHLTRELAPGETAGEAQAPGGAVSLPAHSGGTSDSVSAWLDAAFPRHTHAGPDHARPDALVDVLTAHSDFIEPEEMAPSFVPASVHTTYPPQEIPSASASDAASHGAGERPDATRDEPTALCTAAATDLPDDTAMPQEQAQAGELPTPPLPAPAEDVPLEEQAAQAFHPILGAPTPSFIPNVPAPGGKRMWPVWSGVLALLLLLAAQSIWAERARLAADATWRPWLQRGCNLLGCTLPPWHDPEAMQLMARDVRPHPSVPGALLISASFRNEAPWAQLWPDLDLTLSDMDGQPIARRQFKPEQYLGIGARERLIQPGQTASVTLEVRDPGKQAVAFEFEFH